ncbi:mitochondrial acyl carrier protein [Chamberlinius hualienensis]
MVKHRVPTTKAFNLRIFGATLVFLFSFVLINPTVSSDNLQLVQIVYRHGDRSPTDVLPNDPNNEYWNKITGGFGQLTNRGKQQQYQLGQYIRQRYAGFLGEKYSYKEILINSTEKDRTLMSASSNLAGLYPPSGDEIWDPEIDWQPIPVHSRPRESDYILSDKGVCPKYKEYFRMVKNLPQLQQLNEENEDIFELASSNTGLIVNDIFSLNPITDYYYCSMCHNLTIPDWVPPVWDRMLHLHDLKFFYEYCIPPLDRFIGGPMLGQMINMMQQSINGELIDGRKAFQYSSHDSKIAAFLASMNLFQNITPPYASAVFVELYSLDVGGHGVQVWYRNDTLVEPYQLTLPNCTSTCPLDKFIQLTSSVVPQNIVEECLLYSIHIDTYLLINWLSTYGTAGLSSGYQHNQHLLRATLDNRNLGGSLDSIKKNSECRCNLLTCQENKIKFRITSDLFRLYCFDLYNFIMMNLPALAPSLLKFCSGDNDGVLVFDKYCLELITANSLPVIKDVAGDQEKFLVIYRNKTREISKDLVSFVNDSNSQTEELDLTGCPLECPFTENESILECSILSNTRINGAETSGEFEPFSISESHTALRLFNEIVNNMGKDKFTLPAVVVLCDANDLTSTRAIGVQLLDGLIKRFRITCKEDNIASSKLPKLETIKRKHIWGNSNTVVDVTVKAEYVVVEGSERSFVTGEVTKSEVILECEWKSAVKMLEIPNSGAKCVVHFKIFLGNFQNPANFKWIELMLLENLILNFEKGVFAWSRITESSVKSNLKQLMDDLKTAFNKKKAEPKEKNLDLILASNLTENRKNGDFTDKLWSVLKDCTSCDELQMCLETVFEYVMDEEIKLVIFSKNKTTLGKLINDIYHKKSQMPQITSEMALKCLIEIGIEKLRQDYIHLFLVSGLATKTLLDSIITVNDSSYAENLLSLKRLHLVTEVIVLTETMLNSSRTLLCSFTRKAIKQICESKTVENCHSFSFPIDRQHVVEYFNRNYYPHMWTVSMESKEKTNCISKTVYRVSINEPNKNESYSKKMEKDDGICGEQYYLSVSTVVTDSISCK